MFLAETTCGNQNYLSHRAVREVILVPTCCCCQERSFTFLFEETSLFSLHRRASPCKIHGSAGAARADATLCLLLTVISKRQQPSNKECHSSWLHTPFQAQDDSIPIWRGWSEACPTGWKDARQTNMAPVANRWLTTVLCIPLRGCFLKIVLAVVQKGLKGKLQ